MIGVYGGTFDPVHYGHLRTALEVKETFALDELRLIPCYQSPLKDNVSSDSKARLQMLQLAIQDELGLVCDSRELERAGRSYTVDTLASLRSEFNTAPLLLFMGSDAFLQITAWHQWQKLFDYAHIVVMMRPNTEKPLLSDFLQSRLTTAITHLHTEMAGKLFFQTVTQLDISATAIRALYKQGRSMRFLLPDSVIEYIQQHNLYDL